MSPVFPLTLALYAASCSLYLALVAVGLQRTAAAPQIARAARLLLVSAFVAHAVEIGFMCAMGEHPASSAREALSFIGWLTVGTFLIATSKQPVPVAGAILVPVALVLEVAARVGPAGSGRGAATALASVHIGLATAGVALFAVAAGDSVVYLLAESQLKGRHRLPWGNLPPLETLDRLNRRCIQIGFPLFTFAMVTGSMWLKRMPPAAGELHPLLQPQYALSVVAWLLYAGLLLFRFFLGWRGRRAALVTIGGFAASLAVVLVYYVRDIFQHGQPGA